MSADGPIAPQELDQLFAPLRRYASLVLAVSGGADSMALMHLCAAWVGRTENAPHLLVVTVDHGLRAGSGAEAEWVGQRAGALGLAHEILHWEGLKPATGVQEAAREARYRLLADRARRESAPCAIVTAHHQDDQAETLLMRLARGSGIDGLSGMREVEPVPAGEPAPDLVRPLIGVPRARLVATLEHLGVTWLDDPSNESEVFERVRLRKAGPLLSELGLTNAQLARSARRLGRARQALEQGAAELWREAADLHHGAYATIDRAVFDGAPAELRLRVLSRALNAMGGGREPPRLSQVERLLERLEQGGMEPETLGGAIVAQNVSQISIFREPGREGLPEVLLAPGETATWDGRFRVSAASGEAGPVQVRALGPSAYATLRSQHGGGFSMPRRAAITLPAFWRGEALLAVPHLGLDGPAADDAGKGKGGQARYAAIFLWDD